MAETVGQHSVAAFTSPVNGTTPIDANTVRGNDNTVRSAYVDHDADPGIHVQSSSLASRPTAGTAGRKWITVSSGRYQLWYDDGSRWHEVASDAINVDCLADANLTKGDVVKVTGFNNGQNLPTVNKVSASTDTAFGVVENTVTSGNLVQIVNTGLIEDVDTNGYAVGTILYPNTSGGWTTTKPTSGNYQPAGYVLRGNTNNGVLYVEFSAPRIVERSDNTASTIVLRDASGNFSAGTITAGALTSTGLVTFASLKGTGATTVTNILDEDNMASDSATALATQQSIKAYVDAQVATVDTLAEVLANGNTTGANNIIVTNGQKITTNTIDETTAAAGVTIDSVLLKDNAVTATTFNGTLNGAAPAGSLSGTTLASNVVSSSLTSVGTLANLTVTNPISGSVTGSSGSTTGNAATATALQTARNINGVSFNGTADITVTAAAGTLTGTTLASGVTASSLTSVGTLTSLTVSGDLTVDTNTLKVDSTNNRVGIGVTSPSSALTVSAAGSTSNANVESSAIRTTAGGTLSCFIGHDTGLNRPIIQSSTGNAGSAFSLFLQPYGGDLNVDNGTFVVDAANDRVHIGSSSTVNSSKLTVLQGGGNVQMTLASSATKYHSFYVDGNGGLFLQPNGSTAANLDASGNLGLGVTPSYQFDLLTPTSATDRQAVRINYGTTVGRAVYFGIDAAVTGTTYIQSATPSSVSSGTDLALNPKGGNVGVGTTSPAVRLDVQTASAVGGITLTATTGTNGSAIAAVNTGGTSYFGRNNSSGGAFGGTAYATVVYSGGAYPMAFYTNDTERARITSGGYFKASNTGTYHNATGPYHELYSTSDNNGVIVVKHAGASGAQYGISILTVNDQNDATRYFWACDGGGTERATLRSNGGLANYSANNVNLASDFRLKKDIAPLTSTWDKLKAIEVVNFRYKDCNDGDPALYGVIAQQVQPIVPELVVVTREAVEAKDAVLDEDGNEVEPAVEASPEYYGIREQPMYWLAIRALQEAQARIEALEARLEALEA